MSMKDIIKRARSETPAYRQGDGVFSLQRDINRLFEDFFDGTGLPALRFMDESVAGFNPRVDVKETEHGMEVTAELPGLDEKDVSVTLEENALTISGEKKEEHEEKTAQTWRMERSFGSFRRTIPLSSPVETAKAKAAFRKGVLHVTLPKVAGGEVKGRKIEIKTE